MHHGVEGFCKTQREIRSRDRDSFFFKFCGNVAAGRSGQQRQRLPLRKAQRLLFAVAGGGRQCLVVWFLRKRCDPPEMKPGVSLHFPPSSLTCGEASPVELCEVVKGCSALQHLAPAPLKCDAIGVQSRFLSAGLQTQISCARVYTTREQTSRHS